jgi:hypothetical protein
MLPSSPIGRRSVPEPSGLIPLRNAHIVPTCLPWDGGCIIHSASTRTDGQDQLLHARVPPKFGRH